MGMVAMPLIAMSSLAWWMALFPINVFQPDVRWLRFAVFAILCASGMVCYFSLGRFPRLAGLVLVLGPWLSFTLALSVFAGNTVPFFAVLLVVANSAINPRSGLLAAVLSTISLAALAPRGGILASSLALLWLAAAVERISSQGLYTVLGWAWNSQERANNLLEKLRDHQGELNRTLAALTEAARRLERVSHELAIARLRAEEARQLKEQFAANISHELRTPLNLVIGFSEMMYFSPEVYGNVQWPATLRRDLRQIYQSSRQLLDLVNDVLDLSRIDAAQMPVRKELSDLRSVILEATDTVKDLLRGKALELRAILPPTLPALHFDRTRIRQVLLNLLSNAARFAERGSITITAEVQEREVVVSVADTGVGISPAELARVFDEFHQVDMSLRRRQEGAGLGLAISKRFVELHNGRIWAESEVGKGSTFRFSLPLPGEEVSVGQLHLGKPSPRMSTIYEPSVLVVDRDPAVSTVLMRYLRSIRVLRANDLVDARPLIAEWHPQAVILNVAPNTRSWQTTQQEGLSVVPPQVPLVVCSLPSQTWMVSQTGARGCLTKPITREQLYSALADIGGIRDVLVVDDDRSFVQLMTRFLESSSGGYTVHWAYEGTEAIEQARAKRPDVILLDLVLPGMDGLQVLEVLRSDPDLHTIPVLIVTAREYGEELLAQCGSTLVLARRSGLKPAEVIRYLQAILDTTHVAYPTDSVRVPQAVGLG
jgi:signal transduction histidine kinase/DNA-binding response OmpR family regulator